MEHITVNTPETRPEAFDEVNKVLGALGLYNAAADTYEVAEHDDNKWIIQSNN
jgi:hypothetical protein